MKPRPVKSDAKFYLSKSLHACHLISPSAYVSIKPLPRKLLAALFRYRFT